MEYVWVLFHAPRIPSARIPVFADQPWLFLFSFVATAQAQLLVEHEAGGPDRYTLVFSPPAAYFSFSAPTRITRFAVWVHGSLDIGATLSQVSFDDTGHSHLMDLFATSFTSTLAMGVPAHWQGKAD